MVVSKNRFICGVGTIRLHYCRVCGVPYLDRKDAEECERAHIGDLREAATSNPRRDALNIERR